MSLKKNNMLIFDDLREGDRIEECKYSNCEFRKATVSKILTETRQFEYVLDKPYYARIMGNSGIISGGTSTEWGCTYWRKI